jgi:ABC-2 type transport system permease protein
MRFVFLPDSFAAQEAAESWELSKIFLNLVVWLLIGTFLAIKTFEWNSDK